MRNFTACAFSPNTVMLIKLKSMRWAKHAVRLVEMKSGYRIMVENAQRNRPVGGSVRRFYDIIKIDLRKLGV